MTRRQTQSFLFFFCFAFTYSSYGPETVINDSGYISVAHNSRHLFYWFFESRNDPQSDPFVIWLSGGPGCSSLLALFMENGPYIVQEDLSLKLNPYSWNSNATVLWIDQPAGSGFSYGRKVLHENDVANDMYEFIQKFFAKYPKYSKLDFYIFGESYAGHFVPAVSRKIVEMNDQLNVSSNSESNIYINFEGIGIGNGMTNPGIQFLYYLPFAQANDLGSEKIYQSMGVMLPLCDTLIEYCNSFDSVDPRERALKWASCVHAYKVCNKGEILPIQQTGVNLYDVREDCGSENKLCYDFSLVEKFLDQKEVKRALGVIKPWAECNQLVDLVMVYDGDWMLRFDQCVADALAAHVRVLIYAGEYDFICNWMGNAAWTDSLDWDGANAFRKARNMLWNINGVTVGSYKSAKGLTFLKVKNAGHMVPMDQPFNSLDMLMKHFNHEFDSK